MKDTVPPDIIASAQRSIPEAVYEWLRVSIFEGRFQPGEMLRQEDLARQMGVSRVPVREALQRLEGQGQVVLYPRRGYAVTSLDRDEILEVFELRMLVEERAARDSTRWRTEVDMARVRSLLAQMDAVQPVHGPETIARWSELNLQFHDALLSCGKRRYMHRLASTLRSVVEPYIRMEASMTGGLAQAQEEHHAMVAAFEEGDADAVARISREHCQHTAERLLAGLDHADADGRQGP